MMQCQRRVLLICRTYYSTRRQVPDLANAFKRRKLIFSLFKDVLPIGDQKNLPRPSQHNESPSRVSSSVIFPLIVERDSPSSNCAAENPQLTTTILNSLSWLISTSNIWRKEGFIKFEFSNVKILTPLF
jgi:hypothetical protein